MKPVALALAAILAVSPAHADTLIDHIDGMTTTPFGQVVHFAAMIIGDDSKVVRTYAAGEKVEARTKYHVDGKGRVLLPGLIRIVPNIIDDGLRDLAARNGITGSLHKPGPRDRDFAFDAAQSVLLRQGYTTVVALPTRTSDWLSFRRAGDEGRLRLRLLAFADGVDVMTDVGGGRVTPWLYHEHLRMSGVVIDGRLPTSKVPPLLRNDETRLRNQLSLAAFDGFAVAITTTSPAEAARADAAAAELKQTYPDERLWRFTAAPAPLPDAASDPIEAHVKANHALAVRVGIDALAGDLAPGKAADFSLWEGGEVLHDGAVPREIWVDGIKMADPAPADPAPSDPPAPNSVPPATPN